MPLETSNPICPLCRRLVSGRAVAAVTRLCHECRAMIDVLRPRAVANPGAAITLQYALTLPGPSPVAARSSLPASADAFDAFADAADFDLVSLQTEPEIDYFDNAEASLAPALESPIATPQAVAVTEATTDATPALATADAPPPLPFNSIGATLAAEPTANAEPLAAPQTMAPEDQATDDDAHVVARVVAQPQAVNQWGAEDEKAVTDPWAEPLPAAEYSHNEWPLLMAGQKRPKRMAKWLMLGALLLIVATAAVYFIIIEPRKESSPEPQTPAPANHSAVPATQANKPAKAADPNAPPQTAASNNAHPQTVATAPDATASAKPTPPAPAPNNNAGAPQWKHALQAMASPNQAEALQFAEQLRGAGIPAYMVVADRGSRGRWFRVRIGGFATSADAQRFATEARARARTAGVALKDLAVCDYEKP